MKLQCLCEHRDHPPPPFRPHIAGLGGDSREKDKQFKSRGPLAVSMKLKLVKHLASSPPGVATSTLAARDKPARLLSTPLSASSSHPSGLGLST